MLLSSVHSMLPLPSQFNEPCYHQTSLFWKQPGFFGSGFVSLVLKTTAVSKQNRQTSKQKSNAHNSGKSSLINKDRKSWILQNCCHSDRKYHCGMSPSTLMYAINGYLLTEWKIHRMTIMYIKSFLLDILKCIHLLALAQIWK